MTVHNRRDKTLRCVRALYDCPLPDGYALDVYMTDDGSTDGTAEAVKERFPAVKVLQGDGDLYWNRGMINSWQAAAAERSYDFYLWLNDDTYLVPAALETLLSASGTLGGEAIVVGATASSSGDETTYSGRREGRMLAPDGTLQRCDSFNGNIVLVPQRVFERVGMLDPFFRHSLGDLDYGLRAAGQGIGAWLAPKTLGRCDRGPLPVWCSPQTPLTKRFRTLYSPLGCHPGELFRYEKRHYGFLLALKHWFTVHLRAVSPKVWAKLKKDENSHSK